MKQVKPKKNLGQHFLTDLNVAQRIADTVDACPDIPVLEIGPGMGVLTQYLVKKPREAFKAVETAKQQAETVINDAKAYQNAQLPDAQAKADKLIQNAEYLKQKRINEAVEQVAMFNAMYEEYAQNPGITKSRMYYEAISKVLPGVKLYVNTGDGGNLQTLLPLEPMTTVEGGQ